jgi:hypothetical protein
VVAADHPPAAIGLAHAQFKRRPLHRGQQRGLRLQHASTTGGVEHRATLDDLHIGRLALPRPDQAHILAGMPICAPPAARASRWRCLGGASCVAQMQAQ